MDHDGVIDLVCGNFSQQNTLYRNVMGSFTLPPDWRSDPSHQTLSVALGDIDLDGNLDLVCGNDGSNTTYLGAGGTFSTTRDWNSNTAHRTEAIALGDVNGDGYLDIVCGNSNHGNTLYLNSGGVFPTAPTWEWGQPNSTRAVALGDVDGDGDLDVVFGNFDSRNTLFLNDGNGNFSSVPDWTSSDSLATTSVALGDVDGDGDVDLVCGNDRDRNILYTNLGGTLSGSPTWFSDPSNATWSVALGDVDADGDLDLLCGNNLQKNTIYLNNGGLLSSMPNWSTSHSHATRAVAAGDIDGDGDLDVAYANNGRFGGDPSATIYVNRSFAFSTTPSQELSGPPPLQNFTDRVALGDVDGDGDLDLVTGNSPFLDAPRGNFLFLSNGGFFSSSPTWESEARIATWDVALGDVDGDGTLDLVCGNGSLGGSTNTLYLNQGSDPFFSRAFVNWESDATNETRGVVLGDVNGDGMLDLVCGNNGQKNTLYENNGQTFSTQSSWYPDSTFHTRSVDLGDVDRDGDLDLVCGNNGEANTLYLNDSGSLSAVPAWVSGRSDSTLSVDLGDVNGDGFLDLACGNGEQGTNLYLNSGGSFSTNPDWTSTEIADTRGAALGDVDGDGDLDLVCANDEGDGSHVYINEGGQLATSPVWFSTSRKSRAVALGDIEGDGDLDMVLGNRAERNSVFLNRQWPPHKGGLSPPSNHLPNNSAFLHSLAAEFVSSNLYRVNFSALDVESDSAWVLVEQKPVGETNWLPVTIPGNLGGRLHLDASPNGVQHAFNWDVSGLELFREFVLRLRAISNPSRAGLIQGVAGYTSRLGSLVIEQPRIDVIESVLRFDDVTVGDTTFVNLTLQSVGTATLRVDRIDLPSLEMSIAGTVVPFALAPLESKVVRVWLHPIQETQISGDVVIFSDDPGSELRVPVETRIFELDVKTRLLTTQDPVPNGEPLTVVVEVEPPVRVESGQLFFGPRALHGPPVFSALALTPSAIDADSFVVEFVALIPGDAVTEAGLNYYAEVVNSPVRNTDPPGAPDSVYTVDVRPPVSIAATTPDEGTGFVEGQEIAVEVASVPAGTGVLTGGTLRYRRGGEVSYQVVALDTVPGSASILRGTIPGSAVGARGIEFWVETSTLTDSFTDPAQNPASQPHSRRIKVQDLVEDGPRQGERYPGERYRMLSIPVVYEPAFRGTIEDVLRDELGAYDPVSWRAFRYLPRLGRYSELSVDSTEADFRPEPGRGFFVISRQEHLVGTGPVTSTSTPTTSPYTITLEHGLNQIGNPFAFPVAWDSVFVDSIPMNTVVADSIIDGPWEWFPLENRYNVLDDEPVTHLVPFHAYFVRNWEDHPVVLRVFPVAAVPGSAASTPGARPRMASDDGWRIRVKALSRGAVDHAAASMLASAVRGWDRHDRSEPPPSPENSINVYFPHLEWDPRGTYYSVDVRGPYENLGKLGREWAIGTDGGDFWGHVFRFDVAKSFTSASAGDEVWLQFTGITTVPASASVLLIDVDLARVVDLREVPEYRFRAGKRGWVTSDTEARFTLVVGSEEFASQQRNVLAPPPTVTRLYSNQPNPFNPSTRIRYDLSTPGPVDLRVYDVRGKLVKVLQQGHQAAGRYEVVWHGFNEHGRQVGSGVFFYRLKTDTHVETRKMLLAK